MKAKVRMQYAAIYRNGNDDCTNGGLSSKYDHVYVLDGGVNACLEYVNENNVDIDKCLFVVRRRLFDENVDYLLPLKWAAKKPNGIVMFGGNYAKGDSRWHEWFGHYLSLPIHDRCELQEMYNELTK